MNFRIFGPRLKPKQSDLAVVFFFFLSTRDLDFVSRDAGQVQQPFIHNLI